MIKPVLGRFRSMRVVALSLSVVLAYGFLSFSRLDATSDLKTVSVDLPGVTGANNTVAFAFDRYALVAPYAPSKEITENGDLTQLDNHRVELIDLKKPGSTLSKDLTTQSGTSLYYPTKVIFDPGSNNVYVRGITFGRVDGEIESTDAIAYFHLRLDAGKPVLDDSVVIIDVRAIPGAQIDGDVDFGLGKDGLFLVFTNGASVFSYSIDQGYIYQFPIVDGQYGPDNKVTLLQVDETSNIVTLCWNRLVKGEDGKTHEASVLSFYSLNDKGTLDLVKRSYPEYFPNGSFLTRGSNVVIVSEPDGPKQAMFVTNDGSLCQVSLRGGGDVFGGDPNGEVKQLTVFDELAQTGVDEPSARILSYDAARRIVGVVKQGFTAQISRPSNGRRGRISRPSNGTRFVEQPAITLARFGKKDKISRVVFSDEFASEAGLSNVASRSDSEWLIATYSGKLFSLTVSDDLSESKLGLIAGDVGTRIERLAYEPTRESVVAINSLDMDDSGTQITKPGSVVVGRFEPQASSARFIQMLLPTASLAKSGGTSIRRPCNNKR